MWPYLLFFCKSEMELLMNLLEKQHCVTEWKADILILLYCEAVPV